MLLVSVKPEPRVAICMWYVLIIYYTTASPPKKMNKNVSVLVFAYSFRSWHGDR